MELTELAELDTHAITLRDFFTTLFNPEELVYLFPGVSEAKYHELKDKTSQIGYTPEVIHKREFTYYNEGWMHRDEPMFLPRRHLNPFQRQARSLSTSVISKMNDFADAGCDIFFCINPLTCNLRRKETVFAARHILLESDSADISRQIEVLQEYRPYLSAVLYTGGKSIHAYARIDPQIPNWKCKGWKTLRNRNANEFNEYNNENNNHEPIEPIEPIELPGWNRMVDFWVKELDQKGIKLDVLAAKDITRLSRVPGFPHSKTGRKAEVLFLNPNALGCSDLVHDELLEDVIGYIDNEPVQHSLPEIKMPKSLEPVQCLINQNNQKCSNHDSIQSISILDKTETPIIGTPTNIESKIHSYPILTTNSNNSMETIKELDSYSNTLEQSTKTNQKRKQEERIGMTNDIPLGEENARFSSFIDQLNIWNDLRRNGISRVGLRTKYHHVMFDCSKIMGWDRNKMAEEWKSILLIHPENIRETIEDAVQDLLKHFDGRADKTENQSIYLPNMISLPASPLRKKFLVQSLKDAKCPKPNDVARIILRVLWSPMRRLSVQCQNGELGIKSSQFQSSCSRGIYKPALQWMSDHNLLMITDSSYISGVRTRKYRVNIPLILWHMKFKTHELDWNNVIKTYSIVNQKSEMELKAS